MRSGKSRVLAMLVLLCLLFSGCSASRQAGEPYHVYLIVKSTDTEFWKSVFAGANAAKAEYNVHLTIRGPDTEEEYEAQNEYIREAIGSNADAIVFSAISYTENASAIDEAVKSGIKVVVIDSDVNSAGVSARIGTENVEAGRMTATAALAFDAEDIYVGVVNMDQRTQNGQEREQGLRERFHMDERVKGIYVVNVPTDQIKAQSAAERLLAEHPEINVLLGLNEPLAVGAAMAIDHLGLQESVHMVGFDTNINCIDLMRDGVVSALIVQNPYAMGYLGVETAWEILEGKTYDATRLMDTATTIITRENMFSTESQKAVFSFG